MLLLLLFMIPTAHGENYRRIYGGKSVPIDNYPYQAQIVPVPTNPPKAVIYSSCGGAIVGSRVMLTAGHCTRKKNHDPSRYYVRAGTSYRDGTGGSLHRIVAIRTHDNYLVARRVHSRHDISLIYVDPPFTFDKTRQKIPISLSSASEGEFARSTGWGYMDMFKNVHPKKLRSTELMILSADTCNNHTKWKGKIEANNFCAGGIQHRSTCQGDSGGPLAFNGELIGLVSWGKSAKCYQHGYPTVFTNVTHYVPWIKAETKGSDITYV